MIVVSSYLFARQRGRGFESFPERRVKNLRDAQPHIALSHGSNFYGKAQCRHIGPFAHPRGNSGLP